MVRPAPPRRAAQKEDDVPTLDHVPAVGTPLYLGIDLSKTSWHLTLRGQGETLLATSVPPRFSVLAGILDQLDGHPVHSVYEAGPFGYGLHDRLEGRGVRSIVVSPAQVPVEVGNLVKTDRRDSRKLASTLEAGLLRPIYVPKARARAVRELVRQRDRLQRLRRAAMGRIKSLFLFHGIEIPFKATSHWTGPFDEWLRGLTVGDSILQEVIVEARDLYFELDRRMDRLTRRLRELAVSEEFAASTDLLVTIPGIARLNALIIAAEIGDFSRFPNGEALASYVGLTPSEYSSGDTVRHGRITRLGNRYLRTLLVEASWQLVRKDPSMTAFYEKIKVRRGGKRAIVAVARKLCHRILAMLRTGEVYVTGRP